MPHRPARTARHVSSRVKPSDVALAAPVMTMLSPPPPSLIAVFAEGLVKQQPLLRVLPDVPLEDGGEPPQRLLDVVVAGQDRLLDVDADAAVGGADREHRQDRRAA